MAGELVERLKNRMQYVPSNYGPKDANLDGEILAYIESLEREIATLRAEKDEAKKAMVVDEDLFQLADEIAEKHTMKRLFESPAFRLARKIRLRTDVYRAMLYAGREALEKERGDGS